MTSLNILTIVFLQYILIIFVESKVQCTSGICTIDCGLENCDTVICTNNATSCIIHCGVKDCEGSKMYLAAKQYNNITCNGYDSCKNSDIYFGISPNIPGGGWTESHFSGHINSCNIQLYNRATYRGHIQCFHDIDICQIEVKSGVDNFQYSDFLCELSPENAQCILKCDSIDSCVQSIFHCFAPNCECQGGCNDIDYIPNTAPPSTYMLGIPTANPTRTPSHNPTNAPSMNPSMNPSEAPSLNPSISPSFNPTTYFPTTSNPTPSIPTKSPTVRSRNLHFICRYNDDAKLVLNHLSFPQYTQIMVDAILYSIKQITLQSTNYDEYQYNPFAPWKKAGILDFIICRVFNFELIIDGECPSYSDVTNDAEYIAIGTFEFVANNELNAYKKRIVDIMRSDEFKNKFTENMNNKINNSTTNRRILLEYNSFKAIDINIVDPLNTSLENTKDINVDMTTIIIIIIIIIIVCLVIIIVIFAVLIYIKRTKRKNKNRQQIEGELYKNVGYKYNENVNNNLLEMGEEHNLVEGNEDGITQNIHDYMDQDIVDVVNATHGNNDDNKNNIINDVDVLNEINQNTEGI